jgi:nucleotide-binding universal stress UspA family protein
MDLILVGYDGSPSARDAVGWALAEAGMRQAAVRLVHAFGWPIGGGMLVPPVPAGYDLQLRDAAGSMLSEAVARATKQAPVGVSVTGEIIDGPAVVTLCAQSAGASMVVLGSRGLGGFTGLLAGSVTVGVATHAHCPVVVVRHDGAAVPGGPVVVGIDDSAEGRLAVGFAVREAAKRGVGLVAVRAWTTPARALSGDPLRVELDVDEMETAERHVVREVIGSWSAQHPGVDVAIRLIQGTPSHALTTASADAQLVVVGSRGRGGFRGLLLGSVSHQLLHHARCPVAVVREVSAPSG